MPAGRIPILKVGGVSTSPSRLLDLESSRLHHLRLLSSAVPSASGQQLAVEKDLCPQFFYATTGFPVKAEGEVPAHLKYLESEKMERLRNLDKDLNVATRNALLSMIDYIRVTYGYSAAEAYVIASVAVDLRIGQLVDTPNAGAVALLPLDIFTDSE